MNEHVKELATLAKVEHCVSHVRLIAFAELIVRECADIALREDHDPSDCILRHFGVTR